MLDLTANIVFADGPSTHPHQPQKSMVRRYFRQFEDAITAGLSNGGLIYDTKASMDADLAHDANASAWVMTGADAGIYRKSGASGSGAWAKVADLPYSYVAASNVGDGTADAIAATTDIPVPTADGASLIALPIFVDNTASPVTVSFNGGVALTVKTSAGNDIAPGGLKAGMIVSGYVSGSAFRLLSDQASAAIQAAAEAAQTAAASSAAAAAGYSAMLSADKIKFSTVAALNADTLMSYSAGAGKTLVAAGDVIEAQGFRYEVAAANASDSWLIISAGGVKLYVKPTADGWYAFEAFAISSDATAKLNALLASATQANPVRVTASPGSSIQIDGRLHIAPYSQLDLGEFQSGAQIVLGADGRVTQDGRSRLRAFISAETATRTYPVHAMDTDFMTVQPSTGDMDTEFDLALLGNRQAGSQSLVMRSTGVSKGYAWVRGKADIREFDYGPQLISEGDGYLNSLELDFRVYDARYAYTETLSGTGEIAANSVKLVTQTGAAARAKQVAYAEGQRNKYSVIMWDWAPSKVDGNPIPVVFSEKSSYNELDGQLSSFDFPYPSYADLGLGNLISAKQSRKTSPLQLHVGSELRKARGAQTNILAEAYAKFPVTFSGDLPSAGTEWRMFQYSEGYTGFPAAMMSVIEIDITSSSSTGSFGTELHFVEGYAPGAFKVEASIDGGVSWYEIFHADAPVGLVNNRFDRIIGSAIKKLRLTLTNTVAAEVRVQHFALHGFAFSNPAITGVMPTVGATFFGNLNGKDRIGSGGYAQNAGLVLNGATVIGKSGGPRPASNNSDSVGNASLRYTEVFATSGTINTSDERLKELIGDIPDEWLDAWGDVQWQRFKMKDAVAGKGPGARWHTGLIVQRVVAAFEAHGLDATEIGLVCFDEWDDVWSVDDDPRLIRPAGNQWSIRYTEALAMEAAWTRRQLSRLDAIPRS